MADMTPESNSTSLPDDNVVAESSSDTTSDSESGGSESSGENTVLKAVEALLLDQFGQWAASHANGENGRAQFQYPSPTSFLNVQVDEENGLVPSPGVAHFTSISYDNPQTRQKYVRIMLILDKIHALLIDDEKISLRELYYQMLGQDGGTVTQISEAISAICIMLQIPRGQLHINACSKGLMAGSLTYRTTDLLEVNCSHSTEGEPIPNDLEDMLAIETNAKLVIVIEKDAVFQRLLDEKFLDSLPFETVLITGKGYPDLNTRKVLRRLAFEVVPNADFVCLVDGNPHGMEILSVYKYGSLAQVYCGEPLAVPKINWVGIYPSEFSQIAQESLQDLTERDYGKARSLQERAYFSKHMQMELDLMLQSGKKVEIEHDQETANGDSVLSPSQYLWKKLKEMEILN